MWGMSCSIPQGVASQWSSLSGVSLISPQCHAGIIIGHAHHHAMGVLQPLLSRVFFVLNPEIAGLVMCTLG